uniref:Uncharacterized protein n=1 Tax=Rhizobium rhizogenes TaxID=359 RepID=A0A7S5DQI5_RHIRH|nr:hypothetical protein pC6.5b_315 [Rhizobium rhizogenes]
MHLELVSQPQKSDDPRQDRGRGLVIAESEANTSQLCHGEKGYAQIVIPGCDPPVTFQLAKKTFDEVPFLV